MHMLFRQGRLLIFCKMLLIIQLATSMWGKFLSERLKVKVFIMLPINQFSFLHTYRTNDRAFTVCWTSICYTHNVQTLFTHTYTIFTG